MKRTPSDCVCPSLALLAAMAWLFAWVQPAVAIPDLDEQQWQRLRTARDHGPSIDEPALYPLLENAQRWTEGDEAAARVPDYKAIFEDPEGHRGELVLVEGLLGAPPRDVPGEGEKPLSRPGPWQDSLQQWLIKVRNDPERVLVVYLTNPPGEEQRPRVGQAVRLPARFFKVWDTKGMQNETVSFLCFVGHGLTDGSELVTLRASGAARTGGESMGGGSVAVAAPLLLVVLFMLGFYIFYTRQLNKQRREPTRTRRYAEEREARRASEDEDTEEETGPPLPEDPVEAMREMERRRGQG